MRRIILASKSPRRAELLGRLIKIFEIEESRIKENTGEADPEKLVRALAREKAADVFARNPGAVVIGADTVVYCAGRILGKPKDEADAREMVALLAGRVHTVYTGVCVLADGFSRTVSAATDVTFDEMTAAEMDAYIAAGDWADKAGAYAIQGAAGKHITCIDGDYYNVVGLPLNELYRVLKEILKRKLI
jgi:septum formation protein